MFGVKFSSSTSSPNWPPEPAASTVSPPNSCDPSNANRKLQHYHLRDPYNDPAVGSALPSRIRKALAALRSARRRIVEDGRDLYKGSRTMGVPVPDRRQSRSDGGFLSQPEPGRKRRQIVSPQRGEEHSGAHKDHVGRLCCFASCGAGDERKRRTSGSRPGSIQPVLEQSGGAGQSESEATNPADAGIQAIRQRGGNDLWNRVGREDQVGAVQDGQTRRVQCDDDGTVERGTRRLSPFAITQRGGA